MLGIFTNKPLLYAETSSDWLKKLVLPGVWDGTTAALAARRAAEARISSIASFREKNKQKATLLTAAISLQVMAVTALALAVLLVFSSAK